MLNDLLHPLLSLPSATAYLLVGALCFGEAAVMLGFFLPGETAVVLGGFLAYEHRVNLVAMVVLVVACAIAGDSVGYLVGQRFGPRLLRTRLLRDRPAVDRSRAFIQRRGAAAVFLARFVAVFRALVPGIAGISELRYRRFLVANALGGLVWGVLYTMLGYLAGASYETVVHAAGDVSVGVIAAVVAMWLCFFGYRRRKEHRELVAARAAAKSVTADEPEGESRPA